MRPLTSTFDFRQEFFVQVFRCWLVVSTLTKKKRVEPKINLQKAAFFDFVIKNPIILKKLASVFNLTLVEWIGESILYQSDAEFGAAHNFNEFFRAALYLEKNNYLVIKNIDNDFFLSPTSLHIDYEMTLPLYWKGNLEAVRPLQSKSLSVLQKSILGE